MKLASNDKVKTAASSDCDYILKVLSEPRAGAEIILGEGSYSIGKSDDCDLIFQDEVLSPIHAQLTIHKNGLVLTQLAEKPAKVGKEMTHKNTPYQVKEYQLVTVGNTRFIVGRPGQGWNKVAIEENDLSQSNENLFKFEIIEAISRQAATKVLSVLSGYTDRVLLILIGLLFLIVGALLLGGIQNSVLTPKNNATKTVHDMLLQASVSGVNVQQNDKQHIVLDGYVDNELSISLIKNKLKEKGISADIDIISGEHLVESFANLAESLGYQYVKFQYLDQGVVKVTGYISGFDDWNKKKAILQRDIIGLKGIDDSEIEDIVIRSFKFKEMLANSGLDKKLSLFPDAEKNAIIVKGTVSDKDILEWGQAIKQYSDRYNNMPEIINELKNTKNIVDIEVKAIYINGGENYIVLSDEKKYFKGALLKGSYKIIDIDLKKITLLKNDVEYEYLLN